jgi:hypothetical protein
MNERGMRMKRTRRKEGGREGRKEEAEKHK